MHIRRPLLALALLSALLPVAVAAHSADAVVSGTQVDLTGVLSPPPALSTSGDFATDTFADPWDFNNQEDVIPTVGVGAAVSDDVSLSGGVLTVATRNAAEIRLLMNWSQTSPVLPWGHDGWKDPIDGGRYTQVTMRIRADAAMSFAIRWWNAAGQEGLYPLNLPGSPGSPFQNLNFDLTDQSKYVVPGAQAVWGGHIVRFELFRGRADSGGDPAINVQLDWVRLHRADASQTPPVGIPVPQVITPNETGGADYATTERGNPWDFAGLDDLDLTHDVAFLGAGPGGLTGVGVANDPWVGLALGPPLNTDRYHRLTIDACYDGGFSLGGGKGEGMVGRMAWMPNNVWTETQDFVVFPGCHRMTFDMATSPPGALNDESSGLVTGWRGMRPNRLRFDLNEDPGVRGFTLHEVRLTDDAAFTASYPITFRDVAEVGNATADIYVTTTRGSYTGTQIASGISVAPGVNTFNWDGRDSSGRAMPNGTYWVYIVMRNGIGNNVKTGVGYATGPLRQEKPVPPTPSYYVPLTPARLLDTRTGEGGNIVPLNTGVFTELNVVGVGGVPPTGVTAVVMNVTVTSPTWFGFITAWPSGEPQPVVSNINFVPGQTVPNLVTVKVGANGKVNLFNSFGSTDIIADIAGYYTDARPPSGGLFTAVTPSRLLDTRDGTGTGGSTAPIGQAQSIDLQVTGVTPVPATGVSGVALNVTVDQQNGVGFLTVWPTGEVRPLASTHNFTPGPSVANLVLAKVGAGGKVSIFNSAGSSHVIADVIGYFSSSGGQFVPVTPQRLVDTRSGLGVRAGGIGQGQSLGLPMTTNSPVPPTAKAVIVNVTSVNSSSPSFVTVWPSLSDKPLASTLNPRPGYAVPNQAYLRLGPDGSLQAYNNAGDTDLIVDVFGYVK